MGNHGVSKEGMACWTEEPRTTSHVKEACGQPNGNSNQKEKGTMI